MATPTPANLLPSEIHESLSVFLATFPAGARAKGIEIHKRKAVKIIGVDKNSLGAQVAGSLAQPYITTLSYGPDGWSGECTCPIGEECKHLYALGLTAKSMAMESLVRIVAAAPAGPGRAKSGLPPFSSSPAAAKPLTFCEHWEAKLAELIGRALNRSEKSLLSVLEATFRQLRSSGVIRLQWLEDRGISPNPKRTYSTWSYDVAFQGYWRGGEEPTDPWALWQYLAHDWQLAGRPIPEAFLPMTDLPRVRAKMAEIQIERDLAVWRSCASSVPNPSYRPPGSPAEDMAKVADLRVQITPEGRAEVQGFSPASKKSFPSWRTVSLKWIKALDAASEADWAHLPPPAQRLALALRLRPVVYRLGLPTPCTPVLEENLPYLLGRTDLSETIFLPDGTPFRIEPEPLQLVARLDPEDPQRFGIHFAGSDGVLLADTPTVFCPDHPLLYLWKNRVWRGPAQPPAARLPVAAVSDPVLAQYLFDSGLRLPPAFETRFQTVKLPPLLRLWTYEDDQQVATLRATLIARSAEPVCAQEWTGFHGWRWQSPGPPKSSGADAPLLRFELEAAKTVGARFGDFRFSWWDGNNCWVRPMGRQFPEEFIAWRATLPANLEIEVSPDLRGLLGDPLRARFSMQATPATDSGQDWFDLSCQLMPEDTTLTPEELELLVRARGAWVRLSTRGWQRLAVSDSASAESTAALERLGLAVDVDVLSGRRVTHRFHALQLADAPVDDAALAARLRTRAAELRAIPPPALPAGLQAELRPYQLEGYHFLAHLASQGLGGVLADDMGLGKTLQTLAWLLWLAAKKACAESVPFRALVVAPKSVVPNWAIEAARFAPALTTGRLTAGQLPPPEVRVVVVNYAQLRLRAAELATVSWDAVVLDEGQNIKNPGSATARAARDLPTRHRLVVTGTPIENRLLDLWSLLAFAQPGLLGPQATFQRLYNDKEDPAGARARLAQRVRPFLLRRTKGQVARDLPARIEEEIHCELEGVQRALYEAELKRARVMLMKIGDTRQFDAARFNILQSLLRLRQICCDPRLVGVGTDALPPAPSPDAPPRAAAEATPLVEPAATERRGRPSKAVAASVAEVSAVLATDESRARPTSAKLEALLDAIEPLVAEGHRVLVFSQFVTMLELIRAELIARGTRHLLLTGQTENRQELVNQFQAPDGPSVFLLSLKAAGSGLNLTAASYVVLFDPWWNPAVEAQAIDRTHRIGQTNTVIAYRLIAKDTIEEKIRALQREKADLAAAVVQEESLAQVMDLESLRRILA